MSVAEDHTALILDGTKIPWHLDRIQAWERGERFAPITIDMALTRACNYACVFCYAALQENERHPITMPVMEGFLADCAEMGVKGISLVSDGESTLSPVYAYTIKRGHELGISMASGTNGYLVTKGVAEQILPALTYLRINFDAGTPETYGKIMGVKPEWYHRVVQNIKDMMAIKRRDNLPVTIGMQMVLMPQYGEEVLPLSRLAIELGVDYLVIKHCSDDEKGSLGVQYTKYDELMPVLREAEALSTPQTRIVPKWSKIQAEGKRSYARCYGAPFIVQLSGSGLVAPCGMLFNERYRKFHIGNIVQDRFKDILMSDRYWQVMQYLASDQFDARRMCGTLCLQHKVNEALDDHKKGIRPLARPAGAEPAHVNFI
ncbi:MAG: radical SAM protein [Chloroflexi bacterium]|nr:radical SAM protein [Chloroflexota bacterium]